MWVARERRELDAMVRPDTVAVIAGERDAGRALLDVLGDVLGSKPRSVTEAGLTPTPARTANELLDRLEGSPLLYDIEALCWQPWLHADLLRFLRSHARRHGVVALWPGTVQDRTATFSVPGRRDHVSFDVAGVSVLTPVHTRYPDEVPFTLERTR